MRKNRKLAATAALTVLTIFLVSMNSVNGIEHVPQDEEKSVVTNSDFLMSYYKTVENSLNRNPKVGGLGKATIEGLKSGTFFYHCKLGFFKVSITMVYDNYCDYDVIINGKNSIKCSLLANGKMNGDINISGPMNGNIVLDLELSKGVETGGNYYVTQDGLDSEVFPYTFVLNNANREYSIDTEE